MAKTKKRQLLDAIKKGLEDFNINEIRRGLQRFKMDMMKEYPFYGDILMRIDIREDTSVETAQTNGKWISYNPAFFAGLTEGQRNYVLLHEVLHVLLLHWKRGTDKYPVVWNIACDYVVNGIIDSKIIGYYGSCRKKVKIERPAEGCFIKGYYSGKSAEEYYRELLGKHKNIIKKLAGSDARETGTISVDSVRIRIPADLVGIKELDETESIQAEAQIKELMRDTLKRRGTGGFFIPEQIIKMVESRKLPWHKLLYEFLESRLSDESSYHTPERKYIHMDLIVPGLSEQNEELGEIWAFVDSSGSIGGNDLDQFMTQLSRIAKEFKCILNIAFWDTCVSDVFTKIRNEKELLKCRPGHSGGTDIDCVYGYIKEKKLKPGVMLILSDGYFGTVSPENEAELKKLRKKTILVLSENYDNTREYGSFGRTARL